MSTYVLRTFGSVLILSTGSTGSNSGAILLAPLTFRDGVITLVFRDATVLAPNR